MNFLKDEKIWIKRADNFHWWENGNFPSIILLGPCGKYSLELFLTVLKQLDCFGLRLAKKYYESQIPVKFEFSFTSRNKKKIKLKPGMPEIDYDVFTLVNGDAFIYDTNHKQTVDDITWFIAKMIEGAKLPPLFHMMKYLEYLQERLKSLKSMLN